MSTTSNNKFVYFTLSGIFFLILPLFYIIYWFYCFSAFSNRIDAVEHFKNALPGFMKDGGSSNFIFVLLAIVATILATKGIHNKNKFWHKLSMLVTVLGSLLAFLYLFQMM